jgi:8-oxo-dGTP pyrophosphatase MutT (NUDIX family)
MKQTDWTRVSRRACSDHRILRVREDVYEHSANGERREYVVIESPDWVNVVALTEEQRVVLIRQFRHGVARVTLEIPGGMVDPGEHPAAAALRELLEETGFEGETVEPLGCVWPNPAIQENTCHTFLVRGARATGPPRPDPGEQIEVLTTPLWEVPQMIVDGRIRHSLVVAAFGLLGWVDRAPNPASREPTVPGT